MTNILRNKKNFRRKDLMIDDYMLNKVLNKIKEIIGTEKFDNTNTLIDTDDQLSNYICFKKVVILMTCVIKNDGKLYPQLFFRSCII